MSLPALLPPARRPDARRLEVDRYPFVLEMTTRWGDQDALRHLNNVAINGLYEEARSAFIRSRRAEAGVPLRGVVAAVYVDYLQEGHYPGPVTIGVGVAEIGRSSVRMAQVALQDGRAIGVAEATFVCRTTGGGVSGVPDPWRRLLELLRVRADPTATP